jgi:hypothetical protein
MAAHNSNSRSDKTIVITTSVDKRRIVKVDVKGCGLKWEGHDL